MPKKKDLLGDARVRAAITELEGLVLQRYPEAQFEETLGEDPTAVFLVTTVDVENEWDVLDLVRERISHWVLDERVPVYVAPVRTPKRIAAELEEMQKEREASKAPRDS